jgi:hypothetical protein
MSKPVDSRIRFNWGFWNGRNGGPRPGRGHFDKYYVAGNDYGRESYYRLDETSDRAWNDFQATRKAAAGGGRRRALNPARPNREPALREATARQKARLNPMRKRGGIQIYGRILRIEAQKTGPHQCDAKCAAAGHRYYHNFKPGSAIYGNTDGSLTVKRKA